MPDVADWFEAGFTRRLASLRTGHSHGYRPSNTYPTQDVHPREDEEEFWRGYRTCEDIAKRVVVELKNGRICGEESVTKTTPKGWAADGRDGCNWKLDGSPWSFKRWRLA